MILYSIGDSVTWGAELENKEEERYSKLVANYLGGVDCNNASSGVSNDYIFSLNLYICLSIYEIFLFLKNLNSLSLKIH